MNLDHKLYATRGWYPNKRTTFSVATRGFTFVTLEYGIRMLSYIKSLMSADSDIKTPIEMKSKIL